MVYPLPLWERVRVRGKMSDHHHHPCLKTNRQVLPRLKVEEGL
jgi:hypothetical protein